MCICCAHLILGPDPVLGEGELGGRQGVVGRQLEPRVLVLLLTLQRPDIAPLPSILRKKTC